MVFETYEVLNKAWKTTGKLVFGEEIGELNEYEKYLKEGLVGKSVTSCFSGEKVRVVSEQYNENAKFFDYEKEGIRFAELSTPFDINKIKDIDSLLGEIKERLIYSGNKVLGNSKNVADSDAVVDSNNILSSSIMMRSKYVAYAILMQDSEYVFGSTSSGQSSHIIRCFNNNSLRRCFECCTCVKSADCYFSYNLMNCGDCMFSFNLRAKQHSIANVQLEKEKYLELKKKLIGEIASGLKQKKRFEFSIIDVMNGWENE
ncbi:hypothetical protein KKB44_02510 [Candidatus Micrarchaeota archaeon]|nr:hypothetical protein [Candidatus Micrarchaeota archaeon]